MAGHCSSTPLLPSRRNLASIFLLASEAKNVLELCSALEHCRTPGTPAQFGAGIVLVRGKEQHAVARVALTAGKDW